MKVGFSFNNVYDSDFDLVCRPGYDLAKAYRLTKKVPPSFIISSELFDKYVGSDNSFSDSKPLPSDFVEELKDFYFALPSSSLLSSDNPVINIFLSPSYKSALSIPERAVLNLKSFEDFLSGIKTCYLKLFHDKEVRFRHSKDISKFTSSLIVQVFKPYLASVEANLSDEGISLSSYKGLPDVTGLVAKDVSFCSKDEVVPENTVVGSQEYKLVDGENSGELFKYYLKENAYERKISDSILSETARLCKRLAMGVDEINCLFGVNGEEVDILYVESYKEERVVAEETVESFEKPVEDVSTFKDDEEDEVVVDKEDGSEEVSKKDSEVELVNDDEEDDDDVVVFKKSSIDESDSDSGFNEESVQVSSVDFHKEDSVVDTDSIVESVEDLQNSLYDASVNNSNFYESEKSEEDMVIEAEVESDYYINDEDIVEPDEEIINNYEKDKVKQESSESSEGVDELFIDSAISEYEDFVESSFNQEETKSVEDSEEDVVVSEDKPISSSEQEGLSEDSSAESSDDSSDDFLLDIGEGDAFIEPENKEYGSLSEDFDSFITNMYKDSFGMAPDDIEQAIIDLDMKYGFEDVDKLLRFKKYGDESLVSYIRDFIEVSK